MITHRSTATVVCIALLASGCSTRARNFSATVNAPTADRIAFENDYRTCQTLVRGGHKSGFRSAAGTMAVGAGVIGGGLAVGAGVGAGAVGTGWSGMAAGAGAAMAAATVFVGAAGFGVTRLIRGGKERRFKRAMSDCLGEYGYSVEGWTKLQKRDDPAAHAASVARLAPATPDKTDEARPEVAVAEAAGE